MMTEVDLKIGANRELVEYVKQVQQVFTAIRFRKPVGKSKSFVLVVDSGRKAVLCKFQRLCYCFR